MDGSPQNVALAAVEHDRGSSSAPLRVSIVIRDPVYRLGLALLIQRQTVPILEDSLKFGAEAVVHLRRSQPDIIMVGLPQLTVEAVATLDVIRATCPWAELIAAIPGFEGARGQWLSSRGADDIVIYEQVFDLLEVLFHAAGARAGLKQASDPIRRTLAELSPIKRAVAALLSEGVSDREIGERLVISENTAHKHVLHVRDAFGSPKRSLLSIELAKRRPESASDTRSNEPSRQLLASIQQNGLGRVPDLRQAPEDHYAVTWYQDARS